MGNQKQQVLAASSSIASLNQGNQQGQTNIKIQQDGFVVKLVNKHKLRQKMV